MNPNGNFSQMQDNINHFYQPNFMNTTNNVSNNGQTSSLNQPTQDLSTIPYYMSNHWLVPPSWSYPADNESVKSLNALEWSLEKPTYDKNFDPCIAKVFSDFESCSDKKTDSKDNCNESEDNDFNMQNMNMPKAVTDGPINLMKMMMGGPSKNKAHLQKPKNNISNKVNMNNKLALMQSNNNSSINNLNNISYNQNFSYMQNNGGSVYPPYYYYNCPQKTFIQNDFNPVNNSNNYQHSNHLEKQMALQSTKIKDDKGALNIGCKKNHINSYSYDDTTDNYNKDERNTNQQSIEKITSDLKNGINPYKLLIDQYYNLNLKHQETIKSSNDKGKGLKENLD